MKKLIVLFILAAVLCGCASPAPAPAVPEATEDLQRQSQYELLVFDLNCLLSGDDVWLDGEKLTRTDALEYLYNGFVALRGYRDSDTYAARFKIVPDVLLYTRYTLTDAAGSEETGIETVYHYDPQGNLIRVEDPDMTLSPLGDLWGDIELSWDEDDLPTLRLTYAEEDTQATVESYMIDNRLAGHTITTIHGDEAVVTYTYNDSGTVASWVRETASSRYTCTFTYDDSGNLTRENFQRYYFYTEGDRDLELRVTREYTLDERGFPAAMKQYSYWDYNEYRRVFYDGQINTYTYTCDRAGNVVAYTIQYGQLIDNNLRTDPPYVTKTVEKVYGDYYFYQE